MKFTVKKFFNKNVIIVSVIITTMITVSILGVYLSSIKQDRIKYENNQISKNSKDFFTSKLIDTDNSVHIKFNLHKFKSLFLYALTNWMDINHLETIKFIQIYIERNIINIAKILITDNALFNDDEQYINIKYNLITENEINIDIRWANRNSLITNTNLQFYWNKFNLKINDMF